ncbi:hypothetical protein BpHYR1_040302 [Brachionus plicatilis]|uniref:Uncharacterized protein n=1 Tax=Brachionus plicatilis TaxID=10195 RepID=A0A3M7PJC8_BRAPC|nr:hypothetical protein BpHYR1_040302 [Brachionus plicatilis]
MIGTKIFHLNTEYKGCIKDEIKQQFNSKLILIVSSSDEENEIDNIPKALRTERLKAKKFARSENSQDCFYLVQFCIEPSRHSIVPESKIQLNTDNSTAGVVITDENDSTKMLKVCLFQYKISIEIQSRGN